VIEDLIILRAVERILAIAIGGLSIWCGCRLFLAIPDHPTDGKLEFSLAKNRRLLISRIGPGTFFALFGSIIVLASLYFSIFLRTGAGDQYSGAGQRFTAAMPAALNAPTKGPTDAASMHLSLAFLNDIEKELGSESSEAETRWRARRFLAVKLGIMAPSWNSDWGDMAEFRLWLNETPPRTRRPAFERALAVMDGRE